MKARIIENARPMFELLGKQYPLNCSIRAVKEICKRHQSLENLLEALEKMTIMEQLDELTWLMRLLMEQGAALEKLEGGEVIALPSEEEMEISLGISNMNKIYDAFNAALYSGMAPTIETQDTDEKNVKATEG